MHKVILYTDGACLRNPGPGGWAFVLRHEATGKEKEECGGEHGTTNNRMELLAVIRGLEALKGPCEVEVVSDSEYVVGGIENVGGYAAIGFQKSVNSQRMMKNFDLWRRLYKATAGHVLRARWTRGHAGHPENERCDQMATAEAERLSMTPAPQGTSTEEESLFWGVEE